MQLEGQTGCIGHLRGDFADSGYGFYATWFDHRAQWKTDEFKAELDDVINALREDKGLLHNRYDMSAFAKRSPESAFKGNYCTEFCFRVDTEKYAYLLRCNPIRGDYNFYCYCYVREWLDRHMANAEKGIRFIDPHYQEKFRIPDGGKSSSQQRGARNQNVPAAILMSTTRKSAATFTISASLLSLWKGTGRPVNQSGKNSRPRKPRRKKTMNDKEDFDMAVNQKAVKVINKILDAGFTDEKAIAAMTMDDILSIQGITVAEIGIINDLQKSIKANKVISFLAEVQRGQGE